MPRDTNDYPVIVKSYELTRWTLQKLTRLPKPHRYTLGEKVQELLLELLMQLTDAVYVQHKTPQLSAANRILQKLRILFRLMGDLELLPRQSVDHAMGEINSIGVQVGGWLKSCE